MFKTTTTINTLSELKNPEKILGVNSKIKLSINIHGIYNLPNELKLKNEFQIPYDFELYFFGKQIQGGQFQQRNVTEKELNQLKENVPKAKWNDLDLTLLEPQIDLMDGYNSAKFQQFEDINFFPQVKFDQKNFDFEFTLSQLVHLQETICQNKQAKIWLLAIPQIQKQEVSKQLQKLKDVSQFTYFQTQVFEGVLNFEKMLQNEESVFSKRIFLNNKSNNYIQSKDSLYVNLDLKFDFSFSSIMKNKFQFKLKYLIDELFTKEIDYEEKIKLEFQMMLKKNFDKFTNKTLNFFDENQQVSDEKENKENSMLQKRRELLNIYQQNKNDTEELQQELNQLIQFYIDKCLLSKIKIQNKELYKDEIYNQCLQFFKNIYNEFCLQKRQNQNTNFFGWHDQQTTNNQENKGQNKLQEIEHQNLLYFIYDYLKQYKFKEICLKKIESLDNQSFQFKKLIIQELIQKQKINQAELNVVILIKENTEDFKLQFLLTLIFYCEKKLKETVLMIKYLQEYYPQHQQKINCLIIVLLKEFADNDNIENLICAKNKRLCELQLDQKDDIISRLFDIQDSETMQQKINLEQVEILKRKITKQQEEIDESNRTNEEELEIRSKKIQQIQEENVKYIINLCLEYYLKDIALQFIRLLQIKDEQYYKYKYSLIKDSLKQNKIFKCLENILMNKDDPIYLIEGLIQLEKFEKLCNRIQDEMIEKIVEQYDSLSSCYKLKFLMLYIDILNKNQNFDDVIEILDFAIGQFPKVPYFWFKMGQSYYDQKQFEKAKQYLEQANLLFPFDDSILMLSYLCNDKLEEENCHQIKILKEIKKAGITDSYIKNEFLYYLKKKDLKRHKFLTQKIQNSKIDIDFQTKQLIY